MGIRFLCPNGHKLNVKADLAGKRASCPECGASLMIPAPSSAPAVAPAAIVVSPTQPAGPVWYLRTISGEQLGPATEVEMSGWIAAGRVTVDALVWRDGWAEWKTALEAASLLPVPPAAEPAAPRPAVAAAEVVAPAAPQPVIAPVPDLDLVATEPLPSDAINTEPAAAATYVNRRTRSKKAQLTLAVVMLAAVVVLAGVLVWVIRNNTTAAPPVSLLEEAGRISSLGVS